MVVGILSYRSTLAVRNRDHLHRVHALLGDQVTAYRVRTLLAELIIKIFATNAVGVPCNHENRPVCTGNIAFEIAQKTIDLTLRLWRQTGRVGPEVYTILQIDDDLALQTQIGDSAERFVGFGIDLTDLAFDLAETAVELPKLAFDTGHAGAETADLTIMAIQTLRVLGDSPRQRIADIFTNPIASRQTPLAHQQCCANTCPDKIFTSDTFHSNSSCLLVTIIHFARHSICKLSFLCIYYQLVIIKFRTTYRKILSI